MDDNNIVTPTVARRRHRRRVINYAGENCERVSRFWLKIHRGKIVLFFYFMGKKSLKSLETHQRLRLEKK